MPRRPRGGVEVELYCFFNLGVRWGGWSTPPSGRFSPWKESRYQLYQRLGGPQGRSWRVQKISPPPGFDHRIVQPIASCYTDWAIAAHVKPTTGLQSKTKYCRKHLIEVCDKEGACSDKHSCAQNTNFHKELARDVSTQKYAHRYYKNGDARLFLPLLTKCLISR